MSIVTTTCMIIMSMTITMPSMMISSVSTSYLMKLDSIRSIIFLFIETHMGKIVPYGKKRCGNNIRKKELIEHKNNSQRNDDILMTHHISIIPRNLYYFLIIGKTSKPGKDISYSKYIALFDHIDQARSETKKEKQRKSYIKQCIEDWLSRGTHDESSMNREKNS